MFDDLLMIVLRGVALGGIYALVAMSLNLIQMSSGIINFAQGQMLVLGGLLSYLLVNEGTGLGLWLLYLPLAAIAVGIVMAIVGLIVLFRVSHESHSWLITTLAVSITIGAVLLLTQGPFERVPKTVFGPVAILGVKLPAAYVLAVLAAVAWFIVLRSFLRNTLPGLAMSAMSQNLDAARACGLRVGSVQVLAFVISGMMLGSTGYLVAPALTLSVDSAFSYVLNGFITSVIGGMGSNVGALLAGPLIGTIGMIVTFHLGGEFRDLGSLLILVGILILRPQGLFGRTSARGV